MNLPIHNNGSSCDGSSCDSGRYLALKSVMMPRDTNPNGTIFGGVILSQIDLAGTAGAYHVIRTNHWPESILVTVAMNAVEFHQPVFVGDIVSFWTRVMRIGRTSMTMHVSVEVDRGGQTTKVTEAEITFVAISGDDPTQRQPVPIRGE